LIATLRRMVASLYFFEEGHIGERIVDALKYASGEVICFLDDDDLFDKEKLHYIYNIFRKMLILDIYIMVLNRKIIIQI